MKICFLVHSILVYKQPQLTHRLNLYFSRMLVSYTLKSKQLTHYLLQLNPHTYVLPLQYSLLDYATFCFPENSIRKILQSKMIFNDIKSNLFLL